MPRSFAALTGANLAAQSAEQQSLAAVPLVAVLALGAGPGEIGTWAAVSTLPFLLLGALVGAQWGKAAYLWLALAGFALQAWIIFASPLAGLRRLPAPAA